ncbi:hypothetical protein EOA23_08475 [Mesorhizobium sp. M2A.F.Ca.ET.042.01.1.1]|nr:hypothetical protein EOA23_08475 [Mesorhizobium sp. M2A.F.Ca.ET.042.01.1.1]
MEDIYFCAKTGHRIVSGNVVPFPRDDRKPVPVPMVVLEPDRAPRQKNNGNPAEPENDDI